MTHALRYAANCSMLFTELPLLQRPAAAKAAGFDAIESWWPFAEPVPTDADVDRFVAAVQDAGVRLVGLNFAAGDLPGGDRGLVSWPARSAEFRDNVAVTVGIGERLGTRAFNALYGNRITGADPRGQDELAVDNLALAAAAAGRIDAVVLLEPVSGAERYPIRTAADAVAVIDRTEETHGTTNLALLADLYHLTVNREHLPTVIEHYGSRIGHVQIADAPGRGEPGTGSIDLDRHLTAIEATGYRGWIGLEYKPTTPTTEASLNWLPRHAVKEKSR
jgi:hydroxypyruvate isomerase